MPMAVSIGTNIKPKSDKQPVSLSGQGKPAKPFTKIMAQLKDVQQQQTSLDKATAKKTAAYKGKGSSLAPLINQDEMGQDQGKVQKTLANVLGKIKELVNTLEQLSEDSSVSKDDLKKLMKPILNAKVDVKKLLALIGGKGDENKKDPKTQADDNPLSQITTELATLLFNFAQTVDGRTANPPQRDVMVGKLQVIIGKLEKIMEPHSPKEAENRNLLLPKSDQKESQQPQKIILAPASAKTSETKRSEGTTVQTTIKTHLKTMTDWEPQAGQKNNQSKPKEEGFPTGPMSKVQQLFVHKTQQTQQPVTQASDQIIQQVEKWLAKSNILLTKGGSQQMSISLHPDHLGELTILLTKDDGGLTAKITAATQMAKDLIQTQLHQLKQGLSFQNIQIHKVEIDQTLFTDNQESGYKQTDQEQMQQGEQQEEEKQQPADRILNDSILDEKSFLDWLAQEV